jgi:uncharacterized caspase-like protein
VIGNDAYDSVPVLQKARNDADAMAAPLTKLGFAVISATSNRRKVGVSKYRQEGAEN